MAKKLLMMLREGKERGASLLEYALLAALIAVACIGAMQALSGEIQAKFETIGNALANAE